MLIHLLTLFAGGITALGLCYKGWSVEDCIEYFEQLAKQVFELYDFAHLCWLSWLSWLSWLRAILFSPITNGIYPARNLEAVLQEIFGSDRNILDCSSTTTIGNKIGITVSTIKPEPFIFTNYNRLGDREDKKYKKYSVLLGNVLV
jgi:hypothetical protein